MSHAYSRLRFLSQLKLRTFTSATPPALTTTSRLQSLHTNFAQTHTTKTMAAIVNFATEIFGKINVEVPEHKVLHKADGYEIWQYPASVCATVYASDLPGDLKPNEFTSKAFYALASYIGVFRKPQNVAAADQNEAEKVAMTAPVVMTGDNTSEKIAMTAPVVMSPEKVAMTAPVVMTPPAQGEKIAMTAPVVMGEEMKGRGQSMKFLLPSKYKSIEEAPKPTNPAVKLEMVPEGRVEAVLQFSGNFNMERSLPNKAQELLDLLKRDGVKVVGEWTAHGYNAPFVLPFFKRNEIHVPVDQSQFEEERN